ncbi:MAG TPA: hypothetical protein PLA02_10750 [Brevefilum fermentans]|nr:hypothetical protein [Brevefilum fermentans]HQJ33408.1 hypothetical protein [Anaerolineaceae bacterium]
MSPIAPMSLDQFNQQVLACQDEAFTLAFSILGDEGLACELVQTAILRVYAHRGDDGNNIPVKILQGVILMGRQVRPARTRGTAEEIPGWDLLERCEQEALLLVDWLGKTYHDTALILNSSERDVARNIAFGRCKLTRGFTP